MKRIIPFILLLSLLALQACNDAPAEVMAPIRPVKTVVINAKGLGQLWTFSGTAEDALETDLSFRVAGKIISFPGDQIGRKFSKGDIIARLDPSDYELELRQADANYEQVNANFIRAKADLRRNTKLFNSNVISRGELDQIEADFKSYEAQLSASSKQKDIASKHLTYTTLRAPFNGWIGRVETNIHQNVSGGQSVVSFNAGRQMKMHIGIPDTLIYQVSEGDEVEVRFDALPGKEMMGKVVEVGQDSVSGATYPVKVYLENKNKLIRGGMTGHVSFVGQVSGKVSYSLPAVAVVGKADGSRSIWVVDTKTSTVSSRKVTVGNLSAYGIEILDGVQPGDVVVVRGVHRLKEGLHVRINKTEAEG